VVSFRTLTSENLWGSHVFIKQGPTGRTSIQTRKGTQTDRQTTVDKTLFEQLKRRDSCLIHLMHQNKTWTVCEMFICINCPKRKHLVMHNHFTVRFNQFYIMATYNLSYLLSAWYFYALNEASAANVKKMFPGFRQTDRQTNRQTETHRGTKTGMFAVIANNAVTATIKTKPIQTSTSFLLSFWLNGPFFWNYSKFGYCYYY